MLFLLGNPRSGTSLFRLLMTSHTKIHVPPECGFIIWWLEKYSNWAQPVSSKLLDEFVDDLFSSRKVEFWKMDRAALKQTIKNEKPHNYAALCRVVYLFHAMQAGGKPRYIGDKNNFHIAHVAELSKLFPTSKFIHIVRDGRDVATSYQSMGGIDSNSIYAPKLPSDIVEIAQEWRYNILSMKKAFADLPASRCYEIRYEDLVTEPSSCLKLVCAFLDIDYEPGMLNFYEENTSNLLEPEEFMAWKKRTTKAIDKEAVGKYLMWPEEDILSFENVAADVLALYDYRVHSSEQE